MNEHLGDALTALIDGRLTDAERASAEAHLRACASCRREAAALKATVADLATLERPVLAQTDAARVRAEVRRTRRSGMGTWTKIGTVAAGVVLLAGGGLLLNRPAEHGVEGHGLRASSMPAMVEDTDYDDSSAQALLENPAQVSAGQGPSTMSVQKDEADPAPADASRLSSAESAAIPAIDHQARIAECEATFLEDDAFERVQRIVARYEGEPAYLLTYRMPKDEPTHLELWVLSIEDCGVRYFAERKL